MCTYWPKALCGQLKLFVSNPHSDRHLAHIEASAAATAAAAAAASRAHLEY